MIDQTTTASSRSRWITWWPLFAALLLLTFIYATTLQRDVNGSSHDYLLDVGEIQVALNLWGTIHYTGYPLFTMLSALITTVGREAGLAPAVAATVPALIWSLASLALIYGLIWRLTGELVLPALTILGLGLVETFWLHSVIAEVYSFSLIWLTAALLLALSLHEQWRNREWLLLLFSLGAGIAHHRLTALLLPAILLLVVPAIPRPFYRQPRWLLTSAVVFLAPFLAYLYLPLRAWQGARWVYGQPGTWDGFWMQFTGREVTSNLLRLPATITAWQANTRFWYEQIEHQLPLPLLALGAAGLIWLVYHRPQLGLAFWAGVAAFSLFVVAFPPAVWAPAALMPAILLLLVGAAYGLHQLAAYGYGMRLAGWGSLVVAALFLYQVNRPFILSLVRDPSGREVIRQLQAVPDDLPGGRTVVAIPWGTAFSAAAYGLYVADDLHNLILVDHRANLPDLVAAEGKVLMLTYTLGFWPFTWWQEQLGTAHLATAAPGIAMISRRPLYQDVPARNDFDLGNGISIRAAQLFWRAPETLQLTVYWQAVERLMAPYSVAVHLVRQEPPQGPDDILTQADAIHPVDGWYPTTLWQPGEVIRDDYQLVLPPGQSAAAVRIAMYQVDEAGHFNNSHWFVLPVPQR